LPTGQLEGDNYNSEENINMNKKALCIGINNYRGKSNDLRGCINDAKDWSGLLTTQYNFDEVEILTDNKATIPTVTKKWLKLIEEAKDGDTIVLTYSGHGTTVRDKNGDEADRRDEAICLYDGNMIDDTIRGIFNKRKEGVKLVFISDSCHSGTVSRSFIESLYGNDEYSKPRYLPPEDDFNAFDLASIPVAERAIFQPTQNDMNHVLISGCLPTEYSYDARLNGAYHGAMTFNAIKILKANPKITYADFYAKLRKALPSRNYRQTPQLEGLEANKNSLMFS